MFHPKACIHPKRRAILTDMDDSEYREALTEALAAEIRAEMGRRDVRSNNELARLSGLTPTAVQDRLHQNSRTKKKTPITSPDLALIGRALGVHPAVLLSRAMDAVEPPPARQSHAG